MAEPVGAARAAEHLAVHDGGDLAEQPVQVLGLRGRNEVRDEGGDEVVGDVSGLDEGDEGGLARHLLGVSVADITLSAKVCNKDDTVVQAAKKTTNLFKSVEQRVRDQLLSVGARERAIVTEVTATIVTSHVPRAKQSSSSCRRIRRGPCRLSSVTPSVTRPSFTL